jgi:dihydrofolate reductase
MRKIILNVAMSLDGLIEGPNGEYDWCFDDGNDYGMRNFLNRIDAIFYGRKSYEVLMQAGTTNPFAEKQSFLFSKSLPASPEYQLVSGDLTSSVMEIKESAGKDIWLFGGASLTASMMKAQLVDELLLAVHPIILGKGKALFDMLDNRQTLKLIASKPYSSGLVSMHYLIEKK